MTLRAGMTDLVARLRTLTAAGTADYSLAGTTYWSDEHLQATLDRHRTDFRDVLLVGESRYYVLNHTDIEGTATGADAWALRAADGTDAAASYTLDPPRLTFDASQGGSAFYADYRAFDMNRAAAEVWYAKAAHAADAFDIRTDNHDLKRGQLRENALRMADYYRGRALPKSVTVRRADVE